MRANGIEAIRLIGRRVEMGEILSGEFEDVSPEMTVAGAGDQVVVVPIVRDKGEIRCA